MTIGLSIFYTVTMLSGFMIAHYYYIKNKNLIATLRCTLELSINLIDLLEKNGLSTKDIVKVEHQED